ncbi:hypothetical protein B0H14DRAFT_2574625 [Mycena olivaceomarginata]|nr:hypothetical protein B0H14DRAFT_2574625 [Mycena olivaceomarginata]
MRGPDGDELLDLSLQQLSSEDEEDLLTDEPCSFDAQISSEVARKLADSGIALGLQLDESSGSNVLRPASDAEEALDALLAGTELDEGHWGGAPRNLGSKNRYMLTVVHRTTRLTGCCFLCSSGHTLKVPTCPHVPIRAVHDIPSLPFFDNLAEAISVDIANRATVMLRRSSLPAEFWPSAARHIVWLTNYRTMHDPVAAEVPGMRYWGEKVLVRAEHRLRRCKLDRCLRVGYWLGFNENSAALRIFYPLTGRICVEDRSFVFDAPQLHEDWPDNDNTPGTNQSPGSTSFSLSPSTTISTLDSLSEISSERVLNDAAIEFEGVYDSALSARNLGGFCDEERWESMADAAGNDEDNEKADNALEQLASSTMDVAEVKAEIADADRRAVTAVIDVDPLPSSPRTFDNSALRFLVQMVALPAELSTATCQPFPFRDYTLNRGRTRSKTCNMNRVAGDYYLQYALAGALSTVNPARMSSPTKVARSPSSRVESNGETSFHLANPQLRSPVAATPPSVDKATPAAPGASDAASSIAEELPVSLEVWHELSDSAIVEDLRAKLSYSADTGILVVTWPTALHGSFKWTIRPFSELAHTYPDQFVGDTNIDIPSNGTSIITTPDFAFGKIGSDSSTVYSIILESVSSQSPEKLADKVEKAPRTPEVACVIGLEFTMSRFDGPTGRPRVGQDAMMQFEFITAADAAGLGPVQMDGITWALPSRRSS